LPYGSQDEGTVEDSLEHYWAGEGARLGWVVVCPAAPEGRSFFHGSEGALLALLDALEHDFAIESGRVHVAGVSNGGRSAFRLASLAPERIASLIACPGFPPEDADFAALGGLIETPVALFAGGDDSEWVEAMQRTEIRLRELGARDVSLKVFAGEGHVPPSLTAAQLYEVLERSRAGERERCENERAVAAVLDEFHRAASAADVERYFAQLAPDAVFVGTDASERWSAARFWTYVEPYFRQGKGWTYTPHERHVSLARDRQTAWFDEQLTNAKYGEVRGSGVLRKLGSRWRIAQYVLSFAVPNEASAEVVERIRAHSGGR
jgi:pimeloyl-ACP methyl ester carboxylesterase